ncbi:hypothetical protein FHS95_003563 [Sphingomonas naasensis]|uniref:Beta-lactamase-inhibitor-like PepSY-like domain-containing protein n=1 Tax=Sphingomonas naasensis TaxID=1344951 RepID=A0A4S1WKY8_9SPHN|nr:hypothetical protein [Sphingomonas naasensis]NIJ21852.1 hypothetical protein [Sphingomonas naasensis]TGX42450.1 hypothetical protein E5A74_11465 [Sphingomonas naasensis]
MRWIIAPMLIAATAACSPSTTPADNVEAPIANGILPAGPVTNTTHLAPDALAPELVALIERSVPGMVIGDVERKEREGRIYLDVEGKRPDGSDVELDVLQEGANWRLVEIQRDIAWDHAPAAVTAAARAAPGAFVPERVIESTQTDGSVIYELFAPGHADEPMMEVRLRGGKAEVLDARSPH